MLKSNCCGAKIIKQVKENKDITLCSKCGKYCKVYNEERKTWEINPKTKIIPNKKKDWSKLTKEEIKHIRLNEEF